MSNGRRGSRCVVCNLIQKETSGTEYVTNLALVKLSIGVFDKRMFAGRRKVGRVGEGVEKNI